MVSAKTQWEWTLTAHDALVKLGKHDAAAELIDSLLDAGDRLALESICNIINADRLAEANATRDRIEGHDVDQISAAVHHIQALAAEDAASGPAPGLARLEGNALVLASRYTVPVPCDACGDDLDIHEWIDVDADGMMVNCDRKA